MGRGELSSVFESCLGLAHGDLDAPAKSGLSELLDGRTKNPNPKAPVAADAMRDALDSVSRPVLQKWFWPDGKPFAVFASHDVDEVRWSWRRRLLMAARHPRTLAEGNERYWNFDRVLDLEAKYGVRSSWYFVADGDHPRDPPYRLRDVASVMQDLQARGQEVGVHGSYLSFRDGTKLRRERAAVDEVLGRRILGIRQHYINFEPGVTWRLQQDAGFAYDATLTMNESSGFSTGMCYPYVPPGGTILELPLLLMDGQLFWYEGFSPSDAVKNCERIADLVAAHGGLLTLNWHQHTYDGYSFPGWWDVYEHMLGWLAERQALFMTGEDVWRWWTSRAAVSVSEQTRSASGATWEVTSTSGVKGLAFRVAGAASATIDANAPHSTAKRRDGELLVLPELKAGERVAVMAEW